MMFAPTAGESLFPAGALVGDVRVPRPRQVALPLFASRYRLALAAGVAGAILVASVVPPPAGTGKALGPLGVVGADKWTHALAYATLAVAVAYAGHARTVGRLLGAAAVATAVGLLVEAVQLGLPWRSFGLADAAANALGALAGVAAWRALRVGRRLEPVDDLATGERRNSP